MDDSKRYWFPAKRCGWGWGLPATWQGWVVLVAWVCILGTLSPWIARTSMLEFFAFEGIMAGALVAICYLKGEPPRWRWGRD